MPVEQLAKEYHAQRHADQGEDVSDQRGAELDDLQSLFADEMRVYPLVAAGDQRHSPLGCPTQISPVLIPVSTNTWLDWALEHQAVKVAAGRRSAGKRSNIVQPGQLSIWSNLKEE